MNKKIKKKITQMANRLALSKPVKFIPSQDINTFRCVSTPDTYDLYYVPEWADNSLSLFAHELCHFYLAEKIGEIFCCATLSKKYFSLSDKEKEQISFWINHTYQLVDIQVNRVRHKFFPHLTRPEVLENVEQSLLISQQMPEMIYRDNFFLTLCLSEAERKYFNLLNVPSTDKIFNKLSENKKRQAKILIEYFFCLPELTYNLSTDCILLQNLMNFISTTMEYPVEFQIVDNHYIDWRIK